MPRELVRANLDLLYPPFVERLLTGMALCRAKGSRYYLVSGFRPWGEQHQLRLAYLNGAGGLAAPAGFSSHQYGLGVDFTFDEDPARPGLQPRWKDSDYDVLGAVMMSLGLEWGASYKDRPHINWPGFTSGDQLNPLRNLWKASVYSTPAETLRLEVWPYVDRHSPEMKPIPVVCA